jgi:hypothetical protein
MTGILTLTPWLLFPASSSRDQWWMASLTKPHRTGTSVRLPSLATIVSMVVVGKTLFGHGGSGCPLHLHDAKSGIEVCVDI